MAFNKYGRGFCAIYGGKTDNPLALRSLAEGFQALVPKVSEAQGEQALKVAESSLAWAASENESVQWARALVALAHPATDRNGKLAAALAYPAAAGPATEVLLDAIRAEHPDAPAKEAGPEAALEWLAKTYPDVLRPPLCPPPLQLQPDLKCPASVS